jgi:hypothetical protein
MSNVNLVGQTDTGDLVTVAVDDSGRLILVAEPDQQTVKLLKQIAVAVGVPEADIEGQSVYWQAKHGYAF